ncbi:MAG: hypothetical protein ACXVAH_01875 [Candidatus Limnocylindrales bacterium]
MNEERFQHDLTAVLHAIAGEEAPAALRYRLADVTDRPQLKRRPWFGAPVQLATATAALVVVALVAFLLLPGGILGPAASTSPTPSVSPSASPSGQRSPTASPSVSPTPTSSPTPGPIGWSSLTWSQGVVLADGLFVEDLVPWGDGYVGVGGVDTGSGLDTAFFTSGDGIHWTLVKRLPSTQSEYVAGVVAGHVVRIGDRLLAVGEVFPSSPGQRPDFAPPLWVSDDGIGWTRLQSPSWDAAMVGRGVWRLIAGPEGIVTLSDFGGDSIVLHSLDGSAWTRTTLPATDRAIAKDAMAYADGFVVVGRDGQPDTLSEVNEGQPPGVGRPAAWISADGVHWSEATVEGNEVAGSGLSQVVAVRAGFVALGFNSTADYYDLKMTSWTSEDGRTWSIVSDAQLPFAGTQYPVYAADGDRAVVFGKAPGGSGPAAWITSDGMAWARLAFANSPAQVNCGESSCLRLQQAWLVPDGVIVVGTPGPVVPQTSWFSTGS